MRPFWGATLIDGFEGMEGNGPASGTPVPSRVAIASTDYIAADRVGVEAMGIDPNWIGYLNFCGQFGLGQFDLDKIEVRGEKIASVRRLEGKRCALHAGAGDWGLGAGALGAGLGTGVGCWALEIVVAYRLGSSASLSKIRGAGC